MKKTSKIVTFLGCSMLAGVFVVSLVNTVNGAGVNLGNIGNPLHEVRLTNLILSKSLTGMSEGAKISEGKQRITLSSGLVIYDDLFYTAPISQFVVIGGGNDNSISARNAGVGGGKSNTLEADDSAIGGGISNKVVSDGTGSIIAGGSGNVAGSGAVIIGGKTNTGSGRGTVILGGTSNESQGENSLILGSRSRGSEKTFVWNSLLNDVNVGDRSAYIGANEVLIGTYKKKAGVNLVVSGAVKVGKSNISDDAVAGEIMMSGGCFYAYNGEKWQILGRDSASSGSSCKNSITKLSQPCRFGSKLLQEGDKVMAYSAPYSDDCDVLKTGNVVCTGGQLVSLGGSISGSTEYIYPYCYTVSGIQMVPNDPSSGNVFTAMLEGDDVGEMRDFTFDIISIDRPAGLTDADGPEEIIIMDRNLGATGNDITSPFSWGYNYQWGNNYGFYGIGLGVSQSTTIKPEWNNSYNNSNYSNQNLIKVLDSSFDYWSDGSHDGLWGGANDSMSNNWGADESNPEDRQGPCPDGWHVPSAGEWGRLIRYWGEANSENVYGSHGLFFVGGVHGTETSEFQQYFKLPFAGHLDYATNEYYGDGVVGQYWTSSPDGETSGWARIFYIDTNSSYIQTTANGRANGFSVRCFKN